MGRYYNAQVICLLYFIHPNLNLTFFHRIQRVIAISRYPQAFSDRCVIPCFVVKEVKEGTKAEIENHCVKKERK